MLDRSPSKSNEDNVVSFRRPDGKKQRDQFEAYRDQCIYRITSDRSLTGSQVRLGVVITMHLNRKTGYAYPGEDRLAELTGQHRRNLPRDLKGLSRHIEVIHREAGEGRRTTHYRFKLIASPVMHLDDPVNASPVDSNCITGEREMHHGRCITTDKTTDRTRYAPGGAVRPPSACAPGGLGGTVNYKRNFQGNQKEKDINTSILPESPTKNIDSENISTTPASSSPSPTLPHSSRADEHARYFMLALSEALKLHGMPPPAGLNLR